MKFIKEKYDLETNNNKSTEQDSKNQDIKTNNYKSGKSLDYNQNIDHIENPNPEKENLLNKNVTNIENDKPEIDKILDKSGYTFHTFKIIFIAFSLLLLEGFHLTYFFALPTPLSKYYNLTKAELMFLPGLVFIGSCLGSFSLSFIAQFLQRKNMIMISVILSFIIFGTQIFWRNSIVFGISRFSLGFLVSISNTCSLSILTESLPSQFRGFTLACVWCGYSVGQYLIILVSHFTMPSFEEKYCFITLVISILLLSYLIIISIFYIEDSPRNLILNNEEEKAFEILEKINNGSINLEIKDNIVQYTKSGINQRMNGKFCDLFNNDYLKVTLILTFVRFTHALFSFGILEILTMTMSSLLDKNEAKIKESYIHNIEHFVVILLILSDIVAGIQAEIKSLGRKESLIYNFSFCLLFLILSIVFPNYFGIFIGLSLGFNSISSVVSTGFISEQYCTKVRVNALGFFLAMRRIGGFVSQVLLLYLHETGVWIPYYVSSGIILSILLCLSLLKSNNTSKKIE